MKGIATIREDYGFKLDVRERGTPDFPKLLKREYHTNTGAGFDTTVMANCKFISARGVASGGYTPIYGEGHRGAGGMLVRTNFACIPGDALRVEVSPDPYKHAILKHNGVTILKAAAPPPPTSFTGGNAATKFYGIPALEADGIGDLIRPGNEGSNDFTAGLSLGGLPGWDALDVDTLGLIGTGVIASPYGRQMAQGFGGGGANPTVFGYPGYPAGGGVVVVEYWSADPR